MMATTDDSENGRGCNTAELSLAWREARALNRRGRRRIQPRKARHRWWWFRYL